MMYQNDFVSVIKVNDKILREDGSTVYIPFGSEYSIFMKNLKSQRAIVKISIDGEDVLDGDELVINGNSTLDLERFVRDSDQGNRFKFIQKTEQIQEHRGDKIDDGIIRIEFQYEKKQDINLGLLSKGVIRGSSIEPSNLYTPQVFYSSATTDASYSVASVSSQTLSTATLDSLMPKKDEGITVEGSISNQKFQSVTVGMLEANSHVITLQLKGVVEEKAVNVPITVKTKISCKTCGKKSKASAKFCPTCGTSLNII